MNDYIIRDSSIWEDDESTKILYSKDCALRVGVIQEETFLSDINETRYVVHVWDNGRTIPITCIRSSRFGGIFNYEEYTCRGFTAEGTASGVRTSQAGDYVLVAYLNGSAREGVIVSFLRHRGRKEVINYDKQKNPNTFNEFVNKPGPTSVKYISEFNGIENVINALGEYRTTFKGQPTNLDKLKEAPNGAALPIPTYDDKVGSSYYEFDKTGSWYLNDNSQDGGLQSIKVDKPNGKIEIISGKTSLVINKKDETYTYTQKKVTFNTADEWNLNTKKTNIMSTNEINAKAAKINTEGEWTKKGNETLTGNVKQTGNTDITGNLSSTGITSLAGGSFPLIYDIVLTIGIGNLGSPVISNHVFLKTTKTKAT